MSAIAAGQETDGPDDLERRDVKALTETLLVLDDEYDETGVYEVVTTEDKRYRVDAHERSCTCPDAEHNLGPDEACKHIRRVRYRRGERPLPSWLSSAAIAPGLRSVLRSRGRL